MTDWEPIFWFNCQICSKYICQISFPLDFDIQRKSKRPPDIGSLLVGEKKICLEIQVLLSIKKLEW